MQYANFNFLPPIFLIEYKRNILSNASISHGAAGREGIQSFRRKFEDLYKILGLLKTMLDHNQYELGIRVRKYS